MKHGIPKIALIAALLALAQGMGLTLPRVMAADVSVSAELTRPTVSFGEMAELQVKVTGARQADVPQEIPAEGLQIRLTGQSTQVQMVNFKVTSSAVYSYVVLPLKTGNFTIPSVPVSADGRQFRTASLPLTVVDPGSGAGTPPGGAASSGLVQPPAALPPMPGFSQRPRPAPQAPDSGRLSFGEIVCPKKTIYAGEMVPVEIRYYFDARYPVQVRGKVEFGSEGILVERFPDPKEGREERDGTLYNVLTFRTLLSAVKPGSIDVPAAKLESLMQMPGALPPGFDDPVFQQLMGGRGGFNQPRELSVKTAPLHLEVLPLPKEGRPASFGGAIGQFDIDAVVPTPRPAPGDPATLSIKIGGKGNFRAMGPPILTGTEGWRSYPPTDKLESSDELSYTGVKSFDYTLIAQEPKHGSPGSEFSYFDPASAKYVTLTTKALLLDASPGSPTGAASSPAAPVPQPGSSPAKSPAPMPESVKEGDPLPGITLHSWSTPVHRSEFLIASLAMLAATAALAAFLSLRDLQSRGGTAASRRRRRLAELLATLGTGELDAAASYDAAVEYAGLVSPPSGKADSVLAALSERRDVVKYGSGGSQPLPTQEREQLLQSLRELAGSPNNIKEKSSS